MGDTVHRANMRSTARGTLRALPKLEINTHRDGGASNDSMHHREAARRPRPPVADLPEKMQPVVYRPEIRHYPQCRGTR